MRIVFFGTAAFAIPSLEKLCSSSHQIVCAITQPDRPAGRGRAISLPPLAQAAKTLSLPLFQPASLKDDAALDKILDLNADCFVVVAYGKFLPKRLLDATLKGCINVHPSLLPKYRGAAPINWAILNGDAATGVTTMYISEGINQPHSGGEGGRAPSSDGAPGRMTGRAPVMDAGDILMQQEIAVEPHETAAELSARLAPIGADLLLKTLDDIESGRARPTPQDASKVTFAPALTKEDGLIKWGESAHNICCRIRGLQPWPNAYTHLRGQQLAIYRADVLDESVNASPGTVVNVSRAIHVATGDGKQLCLTEIQLAGKRRMGAEEFLRGNKVDKGSVLS